jgi:hypothetical protein
MVKALNIFVLANLSSILWLTSATTARIMFAIYTITSITFLKSVNFSISAKSDRSGYGNGIRIADGDRVASSNRR